jgi:hypothetical protein
MILESDWTRAGSLIYVLFRSDNSLIVKSDCSSIHSGVHVVDLNDARRRPNAPRSSCHMCRAHSFPEVNTDGIAAAGSCHSVVAPEIEGGRF